VTTKDKTGDQLMASIRKAKTETAATDEETGGPPPAAEATPKTAKARPKRAVAGPTPRRPRTAKKKVEQAGNAGYRSSGRVWPD
jgi:hypothetical protein